MEAIMSTVPDRIAVTSERQGGRDHSAVVTQLTAYQNQRALGSNWRTDVYTIPGANAQISKECDAVTKDMHERNTAVNHRVDGVASDQATLKRRIEEVYQRQSERLEKADQDTKRLDQDVRQAKTDIIQKINTVLVDEIRQETQQEVHELRAALQAARQEVEELRQELDRVKTVANRAEELANKVTEELQNMRESISSLEPR